MTDVKTGPKLVLDHMLLYQILGDPGFFKQVPALFFLKDVATACVAKVVESVLTGGDGCDGCDGRASIKQLMQPAIQPLVATLARLKAEAPDALTPFVAYISARRGFRPVPVVVYHKLDGQVNALEL